MKSKKNEVVDSKLYNIIFVLLGLLFPLVGFILYIIWHNNKKRRAKIILKSSIVGTIVSILAIILFIRFVEDDLRIKYFCGFYGDGWHEVKIDANYIQESKNDLWACCPEGIDRFDPTICININ